MKISSNHRVTAAWTSRVALLLSAACNGELAVVDDIDASGAGLSSYRADGPLNASCACASSDSLMALSCGGGSVPYTQNDVVQTTPDGSVVAFNLCDDNLIECRVIYWDGSFAQLPIASGFLLGLSASGDEVLSSGSGSGVQLIDADGTAALPLSWTVGSGMLSASGASVVGPTDVIDGAAQLVRVSTTTGDREVLGDLDGPLSRAYVSPNATASVGQGYSNVDDMDFAYIWTEQRGLTFGLPGVPEGVTLRPEALSDDGSVVAGVSIPSGATFRWSEAEGYAELPAASGYGEATLLSADGSVVLANLDPEGARRSSAYRWTEATGAVELVSGVETVATAMSDDGSVVVAMSWEDAQLEDASPEQTFVWNAVDGTRSLDQILAARGADTTGWEFDQVRALSGNGKVLLGRATCGGVPTLYRVVLSD